MQRRQRTDVQEKHTFWDNDFILFQSWSSLRILMRGLWTFFPEKWINSTQKTFIEFQRLQIPSDPNHGSLRAVILKPALQKNHVYTIASCYSLDGRAPSQNQLGEGAGGAYGQSSFSQAHLWLCSPHSERHYPRSTEPILRTAVLEDITGKSLHLTDVLKTSQLSI